MTMRNQKFALVDAHIMSRSQHACVSCTRGIRVNNVSCSSDFFCNWFATYSGEPMGAPNTRIPWSSLGKLGSPFQTIASGFSILATLTSSSMPRGATPPLFHTCVLPWWTSMCAWREAPPLVQLPLQRPGQDCTQQPHRPRKRTPSRCRGDASGLLPMRGAAPGQTTVA